MKRLKYVSQFSWDLSGEEIGHLVAQAAAKNGRLGVTGILMGSGRLFFQVLEGPEAHVDEIYAGIRADERHRDLLLLETELDVRSRLFPDWSMRRVDLDAAAEARLQPARELLVAILEKQREIARLTHELERHIWQELSAALE